MPTITLLRHGCPHYELSGRISANEITHVIEQYNRSGIKDKPPENVQKLALTHGYIISSDLPRSIESANALTTNKIDLIDELFREAAMPYFEAGRLRMSVDTWAVVLRLLSLVGFDRNGESVRQVKQRAQTATEKLIELAQQHQSVLLVGHGFLNHFIGRTLLAQGWTGPRKSGREYWEYRTYHM